MLNDGMKGFFARNITGLGRLVRALFGVVLILAGLLVSWSHFWICLALVISGAFALYEAIRGWCVLRACGLRTRV